MNSSIMQERIVRMPEEPVSENNKKKREDESSISFRELVPSREEERTPVPEEGELERSGGVSFAAPEGENQQGEETGEESRAAAEAEPEHAAKDSEEALSLDASGGMEALYAETANIFEKLFGGHSDEAQDALNDCQKFADKLVRLVQQSESFCDNLVMQYQTEDHLPNHCLNVAALSIEIACGLGYGSRQLSELGLCALLHDIGMAMISEKILSKQGRLEEKEFDEIKKHPVYGSDFIEKLAGGNEIIGTVILQEHEREDGSGYPYGLKGKDIHEYSEIIGLADVFEALSSNRIHRREFTQFHAIKEILHWGKKQFNHRILKALLQQFSLFPVNTYVRLNNRALGKVVSTTSENPTRPVVKLLYDEKGGKIHGEHVVELHKEPLLFIVEVLKEEALPDDR